MVVRRREPDLVVLSDAIENARHVRHRVISNNARALLDYALAFLVEAHTDMYGKVPADTPDVVFAKMTEVRQKTGK